MRYEWLDEYLLSKRGAVRDYKIEWQWERYLVAGKMFAATCTPGPAHTIHRGRKMVILKCDPLLADMFRNEYADVVPGFYMDKRSWNTVYLDGAVPDEVMKDMCDMSYRLVFEKLTKKEQREILGK